MSRRDKGRSERAKQLIDRLIGQLPRGSPARVTANELYELYTPEPVKDIRAILEKIPGTSMTAKAERIGISKQRLYQLWHGLDGQPSPELARRIAAVTGCTEDEIR